jgi:L-aminoadipate-semialdehyde dehydrogenase
MVAHFLVDQGIQRGDVVLIYAHRGADIVVTVFGILKAGAAFAIQDPTYPPERQIVILEVSNHG